MYEATKAIRRRGIQNGKLFAGAGIDIGAGPDCISNHGFHAYNWDLKDGDAQLMAGVKDNTFDFVHSSHCLEHMRSPQMALENWIRICKPRGYIVVTVPDEELYEHNMWPSRFNRDHKFSFRINNQKTLHKHSINIFNLLKNVKAEVISVIRLEDGFNYLLPAHIDQTFPIDGPECAIEFILRKY